MGNCKLALTVAVVAGAAAVAAAAAVHCRTKRQMNWERVVEIVKELEGQFEVSDEDLMEIADAMVEDMNAGLALDGGKLMKMLISFVDKLPTGNERGLFYALDLGGTNLRVLRVQLDEGIVGKLKLREGPIPERVMNGSPEGLFGHIAAELAEFVAEEGEEFQLDPDKEREIGFTFSFPVKQTSINSGTLIGWTKGFSIPDMVDRDVVEELRRALKEKNLNAHVAALVNDTVGTLVRGKFSNPNVIAAVILGTGSNAAYIERADAIEKLKKGPSPGSDEMVINMEWGSFYTPKLPLTEYDHTLDLKSKNRGEQIFEKMISGMYLGEIVRLILCRLAEETAFFGRNDLMKLKTALIFSTLDMSQIHHDKSPELEVVGAKFNSIFDIPDLSQEQRRIIVEVCNIVATRGARLAAAGILGILKKVGRDKPDEEGTHQKAVIAVDGALYENYDEFRECLNRTLEKLLGEEASKHVALELTNDGSGIGAALIVASHSRHAQVEVPNA